jgi:transcriptional regulator with XRE-family HTH domain
MELHEILTKTMDRHGIKGRELAAHIGMTPNHLSELRAGRKWVSKDNFIKLLEGMEEMVPGSRLYFCQMLAGEALAPIPTPKQSIVSMINTASDEEIEEAIIAIGKRWKESRSSTIKKDSETTNIYINVVPVASTEKIAV